MKTQILNAGGGNKLVQVDDDKVLIIGEGYITVWDSIDDFYKNLDGEDVQPINTLNY